MDAFAAALGQGAILSSTQRLPHALVVGIAFGVAQGLMPLIGWGLGIAFQDAFQLVDHWIAFVLLGGLGIRMITASRKQQAQPLPSIATGWQLVALAIATSIDAAAAGMTIAMLGIPVSIACLIIAAITFLFSTGGVLLGGAAGSRLGSTAGIVGGLILIILGTKILIEHQFLT